MRRGEWGGEGEEGWWLGMGVGWATYPCFDNFLYIALDTSTIP